MTNARPKQNTGNEGVKSNKTNSNQEKSLLETLNESEKNKVIAKLQETLNSEENIDAMVDFAINTADILEIDWEAIEEPDLIEFIIFCNTYYAQFLTNYMQSDLAEDSIKSEFDLFVRSGFNNKVIKEDSKIVILLEMLHLAYIEAIEEEIFGSDENQINEK